MLTRLRLHQIRCFGTVELRLDPEVVQVFTGANAQGKTTLLEAVCLLMRLQSPRAQTLGELVRFGARSGAVEGDAGDHLLRVVVGDDRRFQVDGHVVGRSRDYLAASGLVVWMGNDDIALVRGGSEGRRRFLDFAASQIHPGYLDSLRHYERALRARNFLLKQGDPDRRQLDAYARLLVGHGEPVTVARRDLVARLAPEAAVLQHRVGGGQESLALRYEDASPGGLAAALEGSREEESRRRVTVAGPHRDDLALEVNGLAAASFASEGQQRTLALALKLAQAGVLRAAVGRWPLLLLDDIFGELDPERRHRLWTALPPEAQCLVTATSLAWLREDGDRPLRVRCVADGRIHEPG